jgi:hypothetical protein
MIPGERQAAGQYISGNAGKSGNRMPHSKTLARGAAPHNFREVLECGMRLPLSDWRTARSRVEISTNAALTTEESEPRHLGCHGFEFLKL